MSKYQGCEGCCGNAVAGDGTTCRWCGGRGDRNGSFSFSVEVEGKTFTTTLWDVDGAYRYAPSATGFSRTLLVEVVGECWKWALEPEWSGWAPMELVGEEGSSTGSPPPAKSAVVYSALPEGWRAEEKPFSPERVKATAECFRRLQKIFSLGR